MTNKLVVIINSLKVQKIKKILLYEMKFLVPNYSCLQNPWLGEHSPQIPVLSVFCPQINLLNPPPPGTKFLVSSLSRVVNCRTARNTSSDIRTRSTEHEPWMRYFPHGNLWRHGEFLETFFFGVMTGKLPALRKLTAWPYECNIESIHTDK